MNRFIKVIEAVLLMSWAVFLSSPVFGETSLAPINVEKPSVRVEAPAFTLAGVGGKTVSLKDYKGKVVLLNFWASWCAPCREEAPALEKLWSDYKARDFVVIAIAADRRPETARRFVSKLGLSFPALFDPEGTVRKLYEVTALPTTYLIGKDGKISGRVLGAAKWDGASSRKLIEEFVNESSAR